MRCELCSHHGVPRAVPSLRLLAAFEAAARLGSASAAAVELSVTHSAVSHAIRALEDLAGEALFERTGRGLRATAAGRARAARVRAGLAILEDAFADQRAGRRRLASATEDPPLVVSVLPAFAARWLAPRLPALRRLRPGLAIEIRPEERVVHDLAAEGVDITIRYGPGGWRGVAAELLAPERVFPVCAPSLLGRRRARSDRAVAAMRLLRHPRQDWEAWFGAAGVAPPAGAPRVVAILGDAGLVLDAAERGEGVALARALLADDALRDGRLVRLGRTVSSEPHGWWLVRPSDTPPERRHGSLMAFEDWLRGEMKAANATDGA